MPENVSQIVKLKSGLPPNGRVNGAYPLAADLVRDSEQVVYAVVALDVDKVEDKLIREDGDIWHQHTPVLHVREIEIMSGEQGDQAEMMMMAARERRTGGTQAPLFGTGYGD